VQNAAKPLAYNTPRDVSSAYCSADIDAGDSQILEESNIKINQIKTEVFNMKKDEPE
jgi:hypothetical protein